jgi:hypothetical protein
MGRPRQEKLSDVSGFTAGVTELRLKETIQLCFLGLVICDTASEGCGHKCLDTSLPNPMWTLAVSFQSQIKECEPEDT